MTYVYREKRIFKPPRHFQIPTQSKQTLLRLLATRSGNGESQDEEEEEEEMIHHTCL